MFGKGRIIFSVIFTILFNFLINSCADNNNPLSSQSGAYPTSYGSIAIVDEYPLYSINYTADYNFGEYLQTGVIPFTSPKNSNEDQFQCTCISASGEKNRLFGRNYDWNDKSTYFLVFTDPADGYSSVSTVDLSFFNYNHNAVPDDADNQNMIRALPYYPFDGMNEKGVVVGMNAVPEAESAQEPGKITIGELQVIRLVLDYASSTAEAVSLIKQYNIRIEQPPIHYLIADSSGHSVAIEFVDGKMEVLETSNPWQVTTNFVLMEIYTHLNAPCWRYKTAYEYLNERNGLLSENEVENLMQSVSVSSTRWTNVFNIKTGKLKIFLGRNFNNPHEFTIR